jgi:peptidoglycan-N-acetylglucosamine deacetylase
MVCTVVAIVQPVLGPEPPRMLVDGKRVAIRSKSFTVADALKAADVELTPGAVFSAGTHTLLGNDGPMPTVLLNGQFTERSTVVYSGDEVTVEPVPESIERLVTKTRPVSIAGLPDVEKQLYHPGRSAVAEQKVGERSGEVVSETVTQPAVPSQPVTEKLVALTFDDGPDPAWTPQVLDILAAEGIHATFCVVGYLVRRYPDLVKRIAAEGHTVCNHTASHNATLDRAPRATVESEIMGGADAIKDVLGVEASFYRPPGGRLSPTVIAVAHERNQRVLHWSVDTSDYTKPPAGVLVQRVSSQSTPGAVVLMHDGGGDRSHTVAALRPMIQALRDQGYGFTTPADPQPVAGA